MILSKKTPFETLKTEYKVPAVLNLQVWDNDSFSPDDFLGTLSINLSHFPQPFSSAEKCDLKKFNQNHENIFAIDGSVRGWLPVYGKSKDGEAIKQTVSCS